MCIKDRHKSLVYNSWRFLKVPFINKCMNFISTIEKKDFLLLNTSDLITLKTSTTVIDSLTMQNYYINMSFYSSIQLFYYHNSQRLSR